MDMGGLGKSGAKSILSLKIFLYANKHLALSKDMGNGKKHGKTRPGDFFGFHLTLVLLHYRGY
jgi:hypothetical protein